MVYLIGYSINEFCSDDVWLWNLDIERQDATYNPMHSKTYGTLHESECHIRDMKRNMRVRSIEEIEIAMGGSRSKENGLKVNKSAKMESDRM